MMHADFALLSNGQQVLRLMQRQARRRHGLGEMALTWSSSGRPAPVRACGHAEEAKRAAHAHACAELACLLPPR